MWSWEGTGAARWGLPVPRGTHIIRFSERKGRNSFNLNPCSHWELMDPSAASQADHLFSGREATLGMETPLPSSWFQALATVLVLTAKLVYRLASPGEA